MGQTGHHPNESSACGLQRTKLLQKRFRISASGCAPSWNVVVIDAMPSSTKTGARSDYRETQFHGATRM